MIFDSILILPPVSNKHVIQFNSIQSTQPKYEKIIKLVGVYDVFERLTKTMCVLGFLTICTGLFRLLCQK